MKKMISFIVFIIMNIYVSAFESRWDFGSVDFGAQITTEMVPVFDINLLDFVFEFDNGFCAYK